VKPRHRSALRSSKPGSSSCRTQSKPAGPGSTP